MAPTWSERLKAKGREEGRQEVLVTLRAMVLRLLEQRFGSLPDTTRERVEAISSLERLARLHQRALTSRSIGALRLQ